MTPIPSCCATAGEGTATAVPEILIIPVSMATAPPRIFIRVDFPAPFSPTRQCTSPCFSSKLTSSSAVTPGYFLMIPFIERRVSMDLLSRHFVECLLVDDSHLNRHDFRDGVSCKVLFYLLNCDHSDLLGELDNIRFEHRSLSDCVGCRRRGVIADNDQVCPPELLSCIESTQCRVIVDSENSVQPRMRLQDIRCRLHCLIAHTLSVNIRNNGDARMLLDDFHETLNPVEDGCHRGLIDDRYGTFALEGPGQVLAGQSASRDIVRSDVTNYIPLLGCNIRRKDRNSGFICFLDARTDAARIRGAKNNCVDFSHNEVLDLSHLFSQVKFSCSNDQFIVILLCLVQEAFLQVPIEHMSPRLQRDTDYLLCFVFLLSARAEQEENHARGEYLQ